MEVLQCLADVQQVKDEMATFPAEDVTKAVHVLAEKIAQCRLAQPTSQVLPLATHVRTHLKRHHFHDELIAARRILHNLVTLFRNGADQCVCCLSEKGDRHHPPPDHTCVACQRLQLIADLLDQYYAELYL